VSALAFDQVTINLGGRSVLSAVSFVIREGEFIGMLGPNGSGKTTLMRAVLGLIPVRTGAIRVLENAVTRGNPSIGYMPQSRANLAGIHFTGWDFVASAAGGQKWGLPRLSPAERREVGWALDMVGATDLASRSLGELSGGERQRLFLSQALLGRPKILLLDEPLLNLDPKQQSAIVEVVRRLQRDLGISVLFSAHELNPLLNSIDRVLYLGGRKAVLGRVDEVITGEVLSRLYQSDIEVLRVGGRIFVMAGEYDVERDDHRHSHNHGAHSHSPTDRDRDYLA
jgi:zinc/manganese transport system ATP-binding protein